MFDMSIFEEEEKNQIMLSHLFLYIRKVYILQVCSSCHSSKSRSRYVKNGGSNSIPWCMWYCCILSLSTTSSIKTDRVWWCGFEWCMSVGARCFMKKTLFDGWYRGIVLSMKELVNPLHHLPNPMYQILFAPGIRWLYYQRTGPIDDVASSS